MRDFIICGTGQSVRPGDRVEVRPLAFYGDSGPGVMTGITELGNAVVRFDHGPQQSVNPNRIMREDDTERAAGQPLWCWF